MNRAVESALTLTRGHIIERAQIARGTFYLYFESKAAVFASILDQAIAMGEGHVTAASVRDIVRRTDLASGTFYNYFKDKDEIFEAVVGELTSILLQRHRHEPAEGRQRAGRDAREPAQRRGLEVELHAAVAAAVPDVHRTVVEAADERAVAAPVDGPPVVEVDDHDERAARELGGRLGGAGPGGGVDVATGDAGQPAIGGGELQLHARPRG